ncbi:PH domain-containing protein [Virgibacillus sp. W0181]|uniref:PH domain-containing protein n=1 Tax=Virgibacillus sp. W0181 TaxID=3391581 RepID=UPI003F4454F2
MRLPPKNNIAVDAIKAWKITASIYVGFFWLLTIAAFILSYIYEIPLWYSLIAAGVGLLEIYLMIILIPKLRYRRWRYEIFEQEIYIQHGILIVTRTLVPMLRVQHVDTKQGPILKRFRLATVTISTAATTHEIPALLEKDASDLRDRISTLAKVDEDDV